MDACSGSLLRQSTSTSHLPCLRQPIGSRRGRSGAFRLPLPAPRGLALRWRRDQISVSSKRDSTSLNLRAAASTAWSSSDQETADSARQLDDGRVQQIHSVTEFYAAMEKARNKLVVVEYAASHSENSRNIYPAVVDLSRSCQDVVFLLVMGDESEAAQELCESAGVSKVPHFVFYKNQEKIHEEQGGLSEEILAGDVLYYGDQQDPVRQLNGAVELELLLAENAADDKLLVVDVGLKKCGPCAKVYPTFIKLAKKMEGTVAFARMHGDENEDTMKLMEKMEVVEVPTFLFIRHGKLCGRYVGSGKGDLIGEILRYQGVRVTY